MNQPDKLPEWAALVQHQRAMAELHMRELFDKDPGRFERYSVEFNDILFDFSKNRITDETLDLLIDLANASGISEKREDMFTGKRINVTENRAVLHTALRNRSNFEVILDGRDVMPDVNRVLEKIRGFSNKVRSGAWYGATGKGITDVVNLSLIHI